MSAPAPVITDVECKSESKPLFFKSILNRLRSEESPPDPPSPVAPSSYSEPKPESVPALVQSQPSHLECNSHSNTLKLRNADSRRWTTQYSRSSKQYKRLDNTATATPNWPNSVQPSDSFPAPAAAVWHPFFHNRQQPPSPIQTVPNEGDFVGKLHPSAVLPASFAYYPYSSLDNDYFEAVAKAAAAAAATSQKPPLFGDKLNANKGDNANENTNRISNDNSTATNYQISRLQNNQTRQEWQPPPPPLTKIILRPQASAVAGKQGIAISAPISTAYVKRGDYVEIEYVPQSKADVGEGGIAISRPELVIHFVDRRK